MSLVGRKVKIARLHTPIHVEGVGQFNNPIKREGGKFANLEMVLVEQGLLITCNGTEALVPFSQIQVMDITNEAPAKPKK